MKTILKYIKNIIIKNADNFEVAKKKVEEFLKYAKNNGTLNNKQFEIVKKIASDMLEKLASISKYDIDLALKLKEYNLEKYKNNSHYNVGYDENRCGNSSRCGTSSSSCGSGRGC